MENVKLTFSVFRLFSSITWLQNSNADLHLITISSIRNTLTACNKPHWSVGLPGTSHPGQVSLYKILCITIRQWVKKQTQLELELGPLCTKSHTTTTSMNHVSMMYSSINVLSNVLKSSFYLSVNVAGWIKTSMFNSWLLCFLVKIIPD